MEEQRGGGIIEWKLSEVNTRAVSRGPNEYSIVHISFTCILLMTFI